MVQQKRRRNADTSRKRLLEAAIKVFAKKGPEAATIDEISEKAGFNKRLTYHYFGSKEGLYKASLGQVYQQFFTLEIKLSSMLLPAEKLLEILVRRYYEFLRNHPEFVKMICFENLNEGNVAKKLNLHGQKAPVITALQLALQKGQSEKRFRHDIDVTDLLISIFALCFFYFSNRYTISQLLGNKALSPARLNKRIKSVVELLLHGITFGK